MLGKVPPSEFLRETVYRGHHVTILSVKQPGRSLPLAGLHYHCNMANHTELDIFRIRMAEGIGVGKIQDSGKFK